MATIVRDVETAAGVLAQLSSEPAGTQAWNDWYTVFVERYGTLVPLADAVNPDSGVGLPAGYPGTMLPRSRAEFLERDGRLLALAWAAITDGSDEIVLTTQDIDDLTVGDPDIARTHPPHVEMAVTIHATDRREVTQGRYRLTVSPGRSLGTLSGRFAELLADPRLNDVYRAAPTATIGALAVQLSVGPAYPHAENVCRVPPHLPDVLTLGEHRPLGSTAEHLIPVSDLAITATRQALHLVSLSRGQVIEPQAFHAMALEKQPAPLARFLAHLPRALTATWHRFDWGPAADNLPYLPRVRHGRIILSPARWLLTNTDLPSARTPGDEWLDALARWRQRWRCPETIELQDDDKSLPLALAEPAHAEILRQHLRRHRQAVLAETTSATNYGWIGGHAHEIVIPLISIRTKAPNPLVTTIPLIHENVG